MKTLDNFNREIIIYVFYIILSLKKRKFNAEKCLILKVVAKGEDYLGDKLPWLTVSSLEPRMIILGGSLVSGAWPG